MKVKVINKSNNPLPSYATNGSAGLDLRANLERPITILTGHMAVIKTGIHLELPQGYEAHVRPRSGLTKDGIVGMFGTIDSDYRGDIAVMLVNGSSKSFTVNNGDRIGQLVINQYTRVELEQVETLSDTERGIGGFGHTGIK